MTPSHRVQQVPAAPQVEIYYASICGLCTKALEFFRGRGVSFSAYALEWDDQSEAFVDAPRTREMYRRCGGVVDFVPQIFIGNRHIRGWRELEPMIEDGRIENLLIPFSSSVRYEPPRSHAERDPGV